MNTNNTRTKHYIVAFIIAVAGVFLDQLTKYFAVSHLKDQEPFVIWKGVFQLEYLENRGAAFGMLQNQKIYFYASVIIISIALIWFFLRVPMDKRFLPLRICGIAIAAGAYGNFIDRVRLGYVVDFFYFKLINFPIFNVADIYVTLATFALVFLLLFYYKEEDLDRIFHSRK